jgi:peptide/nickel transport system substrate-binding protein
MVNLRRLLCGALVLIVALSACTRISTTSQPKHSDTIPGTLRFATAGIDSLNPFTQETNAEIQLDMFIYGWFFYVDDKGRFVPDLALEVPTYKNGGISADGRTLTYHLRRGVLWQDGAPFTARDVIFTVRAVMNPRNDVYSRAGYDDIDSMEAPDDYTVRFHLKRPYAPAIATLFCAYQHSGEPVLPAHLLARYPDLNHVPFNSHPVGTGPFKVREWIHGEKIVFDANPLYWRGPPKLKHIIATIIQDDNTVLIQYKAHELDAIFGAAEAQYPQLIRLNDAKITLVPTGVYDELQFNVKHPPLDDVRIRTAINEAIDKVHIIANVTHGVDTAANSDIPSSSWAYDADLKPVEYDPTAARLLLDKAGWAPGPDGIRVKGGQRLSLDLAGQTGAASEAADALLIQEMLRAVGIEAVIKTYPPELFYGLEGGVLSAGHYDVAVAEIQSSFDPDDSIFFMCDQVPPAGVNYDFWCDPTFDAAERQALANYDPSVRKRYYAVTQRELVEQSPVAFLYFDRLILVTTPKLHGIAPTPASVFNWNSWQWSME